MAEGKPINLLTDKIESVRPGTIAHVGIAFAVTLPNGEQIAVMARDAKVLEAVWNAGPIEEQLQKAAPLDLSRCPKVAMMLQSAITFEPL